MKTIQFDVDGVLADFCLGFSTIAKRLFGDEARLLSTADCETWTSSPGLDDRTKGAEVWQYIKREPNFWVNLPPLVSEEVFTQINKLTATHHVVFVTHRLVGFPSPQWQTACWLHRNGVTRPNVVLARSKGAVAAAIGADFSIEDKAENAHEVALESEKTRSYLIDRLYNRAWDPIAVIRVNTVSEFLAEVQ